MAHKLVTDEMVEKALGEHWKPMRFGHIEQDQQACMRAALEAVANDLIEACAKVADDEGRRHPPCGCDCTAMAIRSLKSQGQ